MMIVKKHESEFFVLLQRRGLKSRHPNHWTFPGGTLEGYEKAAVGKTLKTNDTEMKWQILRRAAMRETIEEAGAGTAGGESQINISFELPAVKSFGIRSKKYPSICLPPKMTEIIQNPELTQCLKCPYCTTAITIYLLHPVIDRDFIETWKPRAFPHYRIEIDEKFSNIPSCEFGYVWININTLLSNPNDQIEGSDQPLIIFLSQFFSLLAEEIRTSIKNLERQCSQSNVPSLLTDYVNPLPHNITPIISQSSKSISFLAIGDFGYPTPEVLKTAKAMDNYLTSARANTLLQPQFILGLGDNFYYSGVHSVEDKAFQDQWENVFLIYKSLRIPWNICLGNHDYEGNFQAQIDFTFHPLNPEGLWRCPSNVYTFSEPISDANSCNESRVDFFCLDTNGCQSSVRWIYPGIEKDLHVYKLKLLEQLKSSDARWKVVFAHHPMYTKGLKHGVLGKCLKDHLYTDKTGCIQKGYGLEDILEEGGVDLYITGHEHLFQHHLARGVLHVVAGAAGYFNGLYGGADVSTNIDWVDPTSSSGFVSVDVTYDKLVLKFISNTNTELETLEIKKS